MLTWRNLYRLLAAAGVPESSCFFTNAYVGLKAGDDPTGHFPGADDPSSPDGAEASWRSRSR